MNALKSDLDLEGSEVVANAAMNRDRGALGTNSYARDLDRNPITFLIERLQAEDQVAWLDLCCGSGKALIEAAGIFKKARVADRVKLVGVDLAGMFCPYPADYEFLTLQESSVAAWTPDRKFDLITCVHGLHYVGDKLGLIERAASWLINRGMFLAHLDFSNIKLESGERSAIVVGKALKEAGFGYNRSKRILYSRDRIDWKLPYHYLGADDANGANFTGQPAVDSWYAHV